MVDKILNFREKNYTYDELKTFEKEILATNDARLMFLFLKYVDNTNIDSIGYHILNTKNNKYIHFFLRTFYLNKYDTYIEYILNANVDSRYLYNILYDVDYLSEGYKIKIINKLFDVNDDKYLFRAVYYYFYVLNLFDNNLFLKTKKFLEDKISVSINHKNYKEILNTIINQQENNVEQECFSKNCFKGRKGFVPNIIVCHITNSYSSAIEHFYNGSDVSSHYIIRRDGYVKQIVSLDDSAWANGTSLNDTSDAYYKFATSPLINSCNDNANYFTFSIEHESYDGSLTDAQLKSSMDVIKTIMQYVKAKYNYDIPIDREHIIGHNEVNPIVRTNCPGNKFPFNKIISGIQSNK